MHIAGVTAAPLSSDPSKKKKGQRRDACSGPRRYGPTNCAEAQPCLAAKSSRAALPVAEPLEGVRESATLARNETLLHHRTYSQTKPFELLDRPSSVC